MEQFRVQTLDGYAHVTVRIAGEVDLDCAEALAEAFSVALDAERPIIVDCTRVTAIDSVGLSALAEARALARKYHVTVRFAGVPKALRRTLERAGVATGFDIITEVDGTRPSTVAAMTERRLTGGERWAKPLEAFSLA